MESKIGGGITANFAWLTYDIKAKGFIQNGESIEPEFNLILLFSLVWNRGVKLKCEFIAIYSVG